MKVFTDGIFQRGTFLRRRNRFLIECETRDAAVRAHLPNPGRLRELLLPGSVVLLQRHQLNPQRSTRYTAVAVEKEGSPVLLHTSITNEAASRLFENGLVPGLEEYRVARREVTVGRSRFDFLLERGKRKLLLEVKSCTLFGQRIAMFPDAVTERGRRHVLELAALAAKGADTGILFIIHWPRAQFFLPDYHTDPRFSQALSNVRRRVSVKAVAVSWNDDMTLSRRVHAVRIPWSVLESEGRDRGAYVIVLRLRRRRRVRIGSLGEVLFRRGFYIYAGSAARGLAARVERHRRKRKRFHWHVDWLRDKAEFHGVFPVRTADHLECEMAAALRKIAEWDTPGFGSSDCGCPTHLFGVESDPLANPGFISLLLYLRIDRLLEGSRAGLFTGAEAG